MNSISNFNVTSRPSPRKTESSVPEKVQPATADQVSVGQEQPVSYARNAFADGVSAASELATIGAGMTFGAIGGFSIGATVAALATAGLAIAGPAAAAVTLVGGGALAVLGAVGGASLGEKVSKKLGEWGSKLGGKLGLSSKSGEAAGRMGMAVGLGAALTVGGPVAFMALASGLANKGVGMAIDAARRHFS